MKIKFVKKVASFLLIAVLAISLAACKGSAKSPEGNLTDKDIYLSVGDYSVSKLELYNHMKQQGGGVLTQLITEVLFKDELSKLTTDAFVNGDDAEKLNEVLDELVNNAIFGKDKLEDLQKLKDVEIEISIQSFVDDAYSKDHNVNRGELFDAIVDIVNHADNPFAKYYEVEYLLNEFKLNLAKRAYAESFVEDDVVEKDGQYEITTEGEGNDLFNYYKLRVKDRGDVELFYFHFLHQNEATAALRELGLKVNTSGEWFAIPDLTDPAVRDEIKTNPVGNLVYAKKVLEDNDIWAAFDGDDSVQNYPFANKHSDEYQTYYSKYSVNTSRPNYENDQPLQRKLVKENFVALYNLVNGYDAGHSKSLVINVDGKIAYEVSGELYDTTISYDDLGKIQSSFRTYVYNTLVSESIDDELSTKSASTLRSIGTLRYLAYKFESEEDGRLNLFNEDETDFLSEEEIDALEDKTAEEKQAIKDAIKEAQDHAFAELKKDTLTSAYINTKVNELIEDAKIDIYDELLRLHFSQSHDYKGTKKTKGGNVIALVDGTEITVDEVYDLLEKAYGINFATDLLVNKILLDSEEYAITKEERESFRKDLNNLITNFSNGAYEQAGFPASIGRKKFLQLAFNSNSFDEALQNVFVIPELKTRYLKDIETHYEDIYAKFEYFAGLQYDNYKSLQVSHLLIYFDKNADGNPDDPQEYFDTLSPAEVDLILGKIVELMNIVFEEVSYKANLTSGLESIVKTFNETGRVDVNSDDDLITDFTELRRHGFYLKFEDLGSNITNSSNFPTSQTRLDEAFYNRTMKLFDLLDGEYIDEKSELSLPFFDLYDKNNTITQEENLTPAIIQDELQSSFGFHFILVNKYNAKKSAHHELRENATEYIFTDEETGIVYSINNFLEDDKDNKQLPISKGQIEYYFRDLKFADDGDDETEPQGLPSSLKQAFDLYFTPVNSKYSTQNANMVKELYFELLFKTGTPTGSVSGNLNDRFEETREINKDQFHNYLNGRDDNYTALFGEWFEVLSGEKSIK